MAHYSQANLWLVELPHAERKSCREIVLQAGGFHKFWHVPAEVAFVLNI